jgi:hypothetical protein
MSPTWYPDQQPKIGIGTLAPAIKVVFCENEDFTFAHTPTSTDFLDFDSLVPLNQFLIVTLKGLILLLKVPKSLLAYDSFAMLPSKVPCISPVFARAICSDFFA